MTCAGDRAVILLMFQRASNLQSRGNPIVEYGIINKYRKIGESMKYEAIEPYDMDEFLHCIRGRCAKYREG